MSAADCAARAASGREKISLNSFGLHLDMNLIQFSGATTRRNSIRWVPGLEIALSKWWLAGEGAQS